MSKHKGAVHVLSYPLVKPELESPSIANYKTPPAGTTMNSQHHRTDPGTYRGMERPPYANLFAFYHEDPAAVDATEHVLLEARAFAEVWRPQPGWVAASAPLPDSVPDGLAIRNAGLAFAEGRERLIADLDSATHRCVEIVELVDRNPQASALASLPGDFGFIRFRPNGEATVVCSCAGLVPFYWSHQGGGLAIGTRLGDFVRYLSGPFPLDPLVNAVRISGAFSVTGDRTLLQGIAEIGHGMFATLRAGREPEVKRYWDPRPTRLIRPTAATMREHEEQLRSLLLARLERDLDPRGGNLLTLSGGVDSSSLAALAVGRLGFELGAWSYLPGPEELFAREMGYIRPLIERYGITKHWITRIAPDTYVKLIPQSSPVVYQITHPALCVLPGIAREEDVRVLVGGEFSDSFLGGHEVSPDWARHTSPLRLALEIAQEPAKWRLPKRWARFRWASLTRRPPMPGAVKLLEFIRNELQEEYAQLYKDQEREIARDGQPLRITWLWVLDDWWVAMNWEATSALGVRRSLPFYNREILELGFRVHPLEWGTPGEKRIVRRALRDDVPQYNLQRSDKGNWRFPEEPKLPWSGRLPESLSSVVRPDWFLQPPQQVKLYDANSLMVLVTFAERLGKASTRTNAPAGD